MTRSPVVIGIAGGSCSGKTSLARALFNRLGPDKALIFAQDDYFYGLSEAPPGQGGVNFDHPRALRFGLLAEQLAALRRGETLLRPSYDFVHHLPLDGACLTAPKPVIIVDGTLILHDQPTRELLDYRVFVAADPDMRLARRIARDVIERGRSEQSVREQFAAHVEPMHQQFVEPSASFANECHSNNSDDPAWSEAIVASLIDMLTERMPQAAKA